MASSTSSNSARAPIDDAALVPSAQPLVALMPGDAGNPIDVDNPPIFGFAGSSAAQIPVSQEAPEPSHQPPPYRIRINNQVTPGKKR